MKILNISRKRKKFNQIRDEFKLIIISFEYVIMLQ